MKEESDVADRKGGDRADFLVAEATLEFEVDDLALVARQRLDDIENLRDRLVRVVSLVEVAGYGDVGLVERRQSPALLPQVERQIATDREQPLHGVSIDDFRWLRHEFDERILHHVARPIGVAEQPGGVAGERCLLFGKRSFQKTGVFMLGSTGVRG